MSAEMLSAVAALLSFLTTLGAAFATWSAPIAAARLTERLREAASNRNEQRRMRQLIFMTLMQERATYQSPEAVRALNLIDAAFIDQFDIRQAWAKLLESLEPRSRATELEKKDRLRALLQAMSASLGLEGRLTISDLDRVYAPSAASEGYRINVTQNRTTLRPMQLAVGPAWASNQP